MVSCGLVVAKVCVFCGYLSGFYTNLLATLNYRSFSHFLNFFCTQLFHHAKPATTPVFNHFLTIINSPYYYNYFI